MATVYGIAFKGGRFLMVFNEKRAGWEMPGGSIEDGETAADAVRREFLEEAGYDVDILEITDAGNCLVCACVLLGKLNDSPEMASELFLEIPEKTAFDRSEYEITVPWARSVVRPA